MAWSWEMHTVPAMSGRAWPISAGSRLKVVDVEGGQSGDVFAVAADDLDDGQSNGRTFDYGNSIRMTTGSLIYSRRSRPLMRIVEDEVGVHDFLYAPCSQEMFEFEYGTTEPHPNCLDNLTTSLAELRVPAATVTTAFNVFMNAEVGPDGGLTVLPPVSTKGQSLTFEAERDLLVAVSACSAPGCNGGRLRSLGVEIGAAT